MTYLGYVAAVEMDEDRGLFVGRIIGLDISVRFEGRTVRRLQAEMRAAIDAYLAECEAGKMIPQKPHSGKFLVRVPPDLHGTLVARAAAKGVSLNSWVVWALMRATRKASRTRVRTKGASEDGRARS